MKIAPPPGALSTVTDAAVLLGDLAHDRQAQAAALLAAGVGAAEEAVEHVGQVASVDAGAVVADAHAVAARR